MHKIFVALDFSDINQAKEFIKNIDPLTCNLKVGSTLFSLAGPTFIEYLHKKNFNVFLDLKFYDIPNTVKQACQACAELGVAMLTVHTLGGLNMLIAAKEGIAKVRSSNTMIMGVTVLTSMDQKSITEVGILNSLSEQVILLSHLAMNAELDGIVCSAEEVPLLKEVHHNRLKLLTPGIRLTTNPDDRHDQSRVMLPCDAVRLGSDYLVIGRPITGAAAPQSVINQINRELATVTY